MDEQSIIRLAVAAGGALIAFLCLGFGIRAGRRRRLIENLPTSKTTGIFIGLVEVKGTVESDEPLTSHLAEAECVWHEWSVSEHWSKTETEHYTDSKGNRRTRAKHRSGWTTVASGGDAIPFRIRDDCGEVLVRPDGAKIEPLEIMDQVCTPGDPLYYGKGPAEAVANSDYRRQFHERILPLHAELYVMGQSRERQDVVAPEIASDPRAPIFIISTRSEKEVSSSLFWAYWWLCILGMLAGVGTAFLLVSMDNGSYAPERNLLILIFAGAAYLLVWIISWAWMVFNSMIELRERVRQAWANVDVQLKRRHDLIPRLVEAVKGMRDYERQVQVEIARLRAEMESTPPGQPGENPKACAGCLLAVIEKYPELKSDGSFLSLQKSLAETENRICLARAYYNGIATFYNTRLEIIPDRFLAALGGMRPQQLMGAGGFEREPVILSAASTKTP